MADIEQLKVATGIKVANCETCKHLHREAYGYFDEHHWDECNKIERYNNLKSFPFKREMPCWEPDFWDSKFAHKMEDYEEEWREAYIEFKNAILESGASNG